MSYDEVSQALIADIIFAYIAYYTIFPHTRNEGFDAEFTRRVLSHIFPGYVVAGGDEAVTVILSKCSNAYSDIDYPNIFRATRLRRRFTYHLNENTDEYQREFQRFQQNSAANVGDVSAPEVHDDEATDPEVRDDEATDPEVHDGEM